MKLKTTAALLAAALMLAGCGSASSSGGSAENVSRAAESSAAESSTAAAESTAQESSPESESVAEVTESESEETSEEESLSAEESTPEDASTDYEKLLKTVDGSCTFTDPEGEEVTFSELHAKGLANVIGEGKAYALTYANGGAGNQMYDFYYTSDGGAAWEKGEPVSFFNGKTSAFPVEDGRLVLLIHMNSDFEDLPKAYTFTCSEDFAPAVAEIPDWFASPAIPKDKPFNAYASYKGGYTLTLTLKAVNEGAESEEPFFTEDITLDPATLAPVS